jgi:hypothetical protein
MKYHLEITEISTGTIVFLKTYLESSLCLVPKKYSNERLYNVFIGIEE